MPFIFNTIGVDDGIAMGHGGMKYSLPSRELFDCVESMVRPCFDGMVCIPNCDKIVPGMLMATMRLNIRPCSSAAGPWLPALLNRPRKRLPAHLRPATQKSDLISVFKGGELQAGNSPDDLKSSSKVLAPRAVRVGHVHRQFDELFGVKLWAWRARQRTIITVSRA